MELIFVGALLILLGAGRFEPDVLRSSSQLATLYRKVALPVFVIGFALMITGMFLYDRIDL